MYADLITFNPTNLQLIFPGYKAILLLFGVKGTH